MSLATSRPQPNEYAGLIINVSFDESMIPHVTYSLPSWRDITITDSGKGGFWKRKFEG